LTIYLRLLAGYRLPIGKHGGYSNIITNKSQEFLAVLSVLRLSAAGAIVPLRRRGGWLRPELSVELQEAIVKMVK